MNNYQFLNSLLKDPFLFVSILVLLFLINYLIFRKFIFSILDPLFLSIFLTVFAQAVVFFLFFQVTLRFIYF